MKYHSCTCHVRKFENWVLMWELKNSSVVSCRKCGAIWKTEAKYVEELENAKNAASPIAIRQSRKS